MTDMKAVRYEQEIPDVLDALAGVHTKMDSHGLDRTIHHLVQLRASQINRCGFCVKMHTKEARADGETSERLDRIIVWDQVGDFSEREKAALAWTEALTELEPRTDFASLRARLREHFSDNEISVITSTVAMINLWNRIQISRH
ncbi:carboxymuconolactone decarboxylase family protein [Sinorhizobium terangae]|uniref:Carboxymuconolactone decarboxylase family protein n=1 Tax=Sinorhizobium terangae TaxID=110322 RepID=A0A6N7LPP4_SINTE|nr:carboxymuconolactone decarboxylase family protein [Sinorhizobium terangae]MBB4183592.1 AhpD family alkylhydroperoxidase [Sinorhizobium terangae]MQX18725.1 carboxymuconolactone decarboxylase family protein [Sinorhizobium terangae]WFU47747.1 carboxymuconolactone decarboxylase family protein [Sinorhizobium terangae]